MIEWCWMNGKVMPLSEATISVEDRGFQFADGVYEAVRLYNGRSFELNAHMQRLQRSSEGIRLSLPIAQEKLADEIVKLVAHSGVKDGWVYLQITRGPGPRYHVFPKDSQPTVLFYVRALPPISELEKRRPYKLISVPDDRWNKCWIKSISLLENVIVRNIADQAGADEAIFIHNGTVTEGSSSNIFMVSGNKLITHPPGARILEGITRDVILECAKQIGVEVLEQAMPLHEAQQSAEVFITSSTREIVWASQWDDFKIGDGSCGPVTRKLHDAYRARVRKATEG
ncbi:MAG TPA: aminotransferase class IV [Tepidisphaeraceae bacterium]|nr:aminotransferase class IV [Tepidisphaeraceae bacterium]